jgi:hypothetical protein
VRLNQLTSPGNGSARRRAAQAPQKLREAAAALRQPGGGAHHQGRRSFARHAPAVTVNFVTQKYHTVHRPALVEAPIIYPRKRHRVLHVRG